MPQATIAIKHVRNNKPYITQFGSSIIHIVFH